jgi:hypothetical protein
VPAEPRLTLLHERGDALAGVVGPASTSSPRWPRGDEQAGVFVRFQNEMIELFGDHRRWMPEPGPFLDDLDAIYRRRGSVPAS